MSNVLPTFSFKRRVAVLFSGGDAPGMNPFLRAFVRLGLNRHEAEVWGVRDGYQGLVRAARQLRSGPQRPDRIVHGASRLASVRNAGRGQFGDAGLAA